MKMIKFCSVLLLIILLPSGCRPSPASLNLLFCAGAMDTEQISYCSDQLFSGLSATAAADHPVSSSCILMGSGSTQDAKLQDAIGQSQFVAMITAQEVDILLCTLDKDHLLAASDSFMALEKIFTAEELTELASQVIAYGDDSPAYGVELINNEALIPVFGDVPIGIFLADNCSHPDLAKEIMRSLILE